VEDSAAGTKTAIGCHIGRRITAYLKNGGWLTRAQQMAARESAQNNRPLRPAQRWGRANQDLIFLIWSGYPTTLFDPLSLQDGQSHRKMYGETA